MRWVLASGAMPPALDVVCAAAKLMQPQLEMAVDRARVSRTGPMRFKSRAELEATLTRYVQTCNHRIPQRALDRQSPIQALQKWRSDKPELFKRRVANPPGLDS